MKVLVSLTNKLGKSKLFPNICLLEIDSCNGAVKPVKLEHPNYPDLANHLSGCTGLAFHQNTILVATFGCLYVQLNNKYQVIRVWRVPVEQAHSIISVDGKIYTASTVNDSVVESIPFQDSHNIFWAKDISNRRTDTIHVNSVAHCKGTFYISAFGPKDDLWNTARLGFIKKVPTGEVIIDSLTHPHTLTSFDGELYYCNSSTSEVCKVGSSEKLVVDPSSYARGMAFTDKVFAVATSRGRTKSKSTGKVLVNNLTHSGEPTGHCAVHFYERAPTLSKYRLIKKVNLNDYGSEIFDLLPLDGFLKKPGFLSGFKGWLKNKIYEASKF
jgi:hypothetical protein